MHFNIAQNIPLLRLGYYCSLPLWGCGILSIVEAEVCCERLRELSYGREENL